MIIFLRNRALLLHSDRSFLRIMETCLWLYWFWSIWLSWYQGHISITSSWTRCLSWIILATIICLEGGTSHIGWVLRALRYVAKALVITSALFAVLFAHWIGLSLLMKLCHWVLLRFPLSYLSIDFWKLGCASYLLARDLLLTVILSIFNKLRSLLTLRT